MGWETILESESKKQKKKSLVTFGFSGGTERGHCEDELRDLVRSVMYYGGYPFKALRTKQIGRFQNQFCISLQCK